MLISNPLTHPLFMPLLRSMALMLSGGLIAIFAALRKQPVPLAASLLFIRWRTWALLAPLSIAAVLAGSGIFCALVVIITLIALAEFARLVDLSAAQRLSTQIAAVVIGLVALQQPAQLPAFLLAGALVVSIVSMYQNLPFEKSALAVLALLYLPCLGSYAILLRSLPQGEGVLLVSLTASAIANIAAFVFGKTFGGAKLAPRISPNKTWSGAIGSLIGAMTIFAALNFATPGLLLVDRLNLALIVAVLGIIGDLFESQIKRACGAKDAGTWLPGFGGALDRIDGLLFVLPGVYYYLTLCCR